MTTLQKDCEHYEVALSALLDGELPPGDVAEAVEHALGCASCAAFFRAARRLGESALALAGDGPALGDESAERLWEGIRDLSRTDRDSTVVAIDARRGAPGRPATGWLRAAALVAVGLGGGFALSSLAGPAGAPLALPSAGETVAASASSTMDERRFVALADELMRSDVRYQRAMLQVLRLVPALETGEGLGREDETPRYVTAAAREDRSRNGLL